MTSKARQLASEPNQQQAGRRNLILNGAMQVAQRGTSTTGITSDGYFACDRVKHQTSNLGETVRTIEQVTDAPSGFAHSHKATVTTAETALSSGDIFYPLVYHIEGQDLQSLAYNTTDAKDITLSFWVKASETGDYVLSVYNEDASRHAGKTYTVSSSNTWEYKTLTFSGDQSAGFDDDSNKSLGLYFVGGIGSSFTTGTLPSNWEGFVNSNFAAGQTVQMHTVLNSTFQITGVQLELGSVATPFEHRSYGEELALCQRYYWKMSETDNSSDQISVCNMVSYGSSAAYGIMDYPQTMRSSPSFSAGQTTSNGVRLYRADGSAIDEDASQLVFDTKGPRTVRINLSSTSITTNSAGWLSLINSKGGYIEADAEL